MGTQNARGIFRSVDEGLTWTPKFNGIIEVGLSVRGFAVEPGNSDTVYAAGEISSFDWSGEIKLGREFDLTKGVVYKTTDGGENWTAVWRGDNLDRYIWIDPRDHNVIYVSTGIFDREAANSDPVNEGTPGGVGVIKSTDGGATWSQINNGLSNLYVGSLFMHPDDPCNRRASSAPPATTVSSGELPSTTLTASGWTVPTATPSPDRVARIATCRIPGRSTSRDPKKGAGCETPQLFSDTTCPARRTSTSSKML